MVNVADLVTLPELKEGLTRLDQKLRSVVVTEDPFLTEMAGHLIAAGGKRIRPSVTIASALTSVDGPVPQAVIDGGAAVELVHLGSLYHDDVLDGALMRRTVPSVNAKWGNFLAIIAGDFLLARASEIAAELGTEVTKILARTIAELCEGQVREQKYAFDCSRSPESYRSSISGKTASLIGAAARIGAITAGMPQAQVEALTSYAHSFGMAFQVRDDVIDVLWTDEQLGKPAGNDLLEGVYTLPVIHALGEAGTSERLGALLGKQLEPAGHQEALELIRSSGGIQAACVEGRDWAKKATDALGDLPESQMRERLAALAEALFDDLN